MNAGEFVGALVSGSIFGGIAALLVAIPQIRKIRSEARKSDVDAAVAEDRADDEHWAAIIQTQAEAVVRPLREELDRVSAKAAALEQRLDRMQADFDTLRTRYWRAISHIRSLMTWIHRHHTDPDSLPSAPAEISADI